MQVLLTLRYLLRQVQKFNFKTVAHLNTPVIAVLDDQPGKLPSVEVREQIRSLA